ncbi:MAG: hypothetical protein ACSHWW_07740 [Nonlabens sp.]|uniref:hypothetical protein n=1 Tax=Nonlabens sp. TaxID=1888209 RepID=UPI003EF6C904
MKKIIAFSLYGHQEIYCNGALENVMIAKDLFPDWICRFYIDNTVPEECINSLKQLGSEIEIRTNNVGISGMFWRFEPLFETNTIMLSRDADSRLSLREKEAVEEWLQSGKSFHIIRDHPMHAAKIMGGMFGSRNSLKLRKALKVFQGFQRTANYGDDQHFLSRVIYPIIKNDVLIHSSGIKYDNEIINKIQLAKNNNNFIGQSYRGLTSNPQDPDISKHLKSTKKERFQVFYYRLLMALKS